MTSGICVHLSRGNSESYKGIAHSYNFRLLVTENLLGSQSKSMTSNYHYDWVHGGKYTSCVTLVILDHQNFGDPYISLLLTLVNFCSRFSHFCNAYIVKK